jgi:Na+/H+-dicarboxylate symporter
MKKSSANIQILIAFLLAAICAWVGFAPCKVISHFISTLFMKTLKLICTPMIFLSVISCICGMKSFKLMQNMGKKIVFYTFLTTFLAACVALALFLIIKPSYTLNATTTMSATHSVSYIDSFLAIYPENVLKVFLDSNVVGIVFIALCLGGAILSLKEESKELFSNLFDGLFKALLKITSKIIKVLPLGVWAFSYDFFTMALKSDMTKLKPLFLFTICILLANVIQGFIVLPLILKFKGLKPLEIIKAMIEPVTMGFVSKSSSMALPLAMQKIKSRLGVKESVANLTLPLCTTINMNGCAAFILITTLFVAMSQGVVFGALDLFVWLFVAVLAAVGNASIPMGCYFLASAILSSMGLDLTLMGVILPIYAFIDMVETALNVWSDCCVTVLVDRDLKKDLKEPLLA